MPHDDERPKSKSQKKREMNALQELGARLLELSPEAVERIGLPEDLRLAVAEARAMKSREALRRQVQYIGTLMREADPEPVRRALELKDQDRLHDARAFQELEDWRDRLLAGDEAALREIAAACPSADTRRLLSLAAEARKEREAGRTPRAFRALFRMLRDLRGQ